MAPDICSVCIDWLLAYGAIILFVLLALGIFALPVPDDTLLIAAGVLIEKGDLPFVPTFIAAFFGSTVGISMSYVLGRFAGIWVKKFLIHRGFLTEERIEKGNYWFNKSGKWLVFVCYFVPVLRHVAGFVVGSARLKITDFMMYAYSGAFIWVSVYLFLGYYIKKLASRI